MLAPGADHLQSSFYYESKDCWPLLLVLVAPGAGPCLPLEVCELCCLLCLLLSCEWGHVKARAGHLAGGAICRGLGVGRVGGAAGRKTDRQPECWAHGGFDHVAAAAYWVRCGSWKPMTLHN